MNELPKQHLLNRQINGVRAVSVTLSLAVLLTATIAQAATSPSLGQADPFGVLSGTYTNTVPGTVINGDLGYTTGPAVAPTVNGTTYVAGATYAQAGIDQGAALTALDNQACTFTFPAGAVDLASNAQFPTSTYGPGVYCVTGAISIGAGGITISGAGTHIFRTTGALDSVAGSVVTLAGTSVCDVWWTPIGATTLGANSTFKGTVIDAAGITVGSTVTWNGKALAFGGTVTTDTDTITTASCAPIPATLTLTKTVVNDNGGTKAVSDFPLFIDGMSVTSGVATTTLTPGSYTASETNDPEYVAGAWTGDCAADGTIVLADGDTKACALTNNDIAPVIVPPPPPPPTGSHGGHGRSGQSQAAPLSASTTVVNTIPVINTSVSVGTTTPVSTVTPKLPNTGIGPDSSHVPYVLVAIAALFGSATALFVLRRKVGVVHAV